MNGFVSNLVTATGAVTLALALASLSSAACAADPPPLFGTLQSDPARAASNHAAGFRLARVLPTASQYSIVEAVTV